MELSTASGHRTDWLRELLGDIRRLTEAIESVQIDDAKVRASSIESVRATLELDGAHVDSDRVRDVVADQRSGDRQPPASAPNAPPPSWWTAMRAGDLDDDRVRASEIRGALSALTSDDQLSMLTTEPLAALRELHRRLTAGLVEPERVGELRQLAQAVHDASVGRIVYFALDPAHIDAALETFARSIVDHDDPVVTAGMAHLHLLHTHPFDAANGRLARTVARLLLRAGGIDPHGLAAFEPVLASDPLGYHERVAAALRQRDPSTWLEYWTETVVEALRTAARDVGAVDGGVDDGAARVLGPLPEAFTLVDFQVLADTDVTSARRELSALADAGAVRMVRGSNGLRFTRSRT